ncbi:hypothetical protein [Jatrophihabitans sp.]|uniref:hypothetical protein n=1 Tax=Jatrophihabitans sp. TaxID=1932789 RepID=UPI002B5549F6|nr:hypothetical protein [Jatrophihabitans sp.]
MSNHPPDPGDVDWLDLGPDPDEGKPPRDPRRRYLWYGGGAALVVALLVARTQNGTDRAASAPRSPAATVSSSSAAASVSAAAPASSGSFANPTATPTAFPNVPVQVSNAGHRLLDVPADWELFARGEDTVIRIQLALGRATITAVPSTNPESSVLFVVGADRAIVRPLDNIPGSVVRDGKPAADLPQSLSQVFTLLPGPDARHLWTEQGGGLSLITLDGKPTGATIDIPSSGSVVGSDGAGYALLSGMTGGTYYATPRAVHRITSGLLVASGPTRWLTVECDDSLNCALVVIDRASGARRTVETVTGMYGQNNLPLSPDGRTLATPQLNDISGGTVELLDLDSGVRRLLDVTPNGTDQPIGPSLVWSPDSRWLFIVNADRQVVVVNRATGKVTPLGMDLPPVLQLAWRPRTG